MAEVRPLEGLSSEDAAKLQRKHGKNVLVPEKKGGFLRKFLHIVSEPMFLLLIAASAIYFVLGEARDGAVMLVFVVAVIAIDVLQEWKADKTLKALRELTAPRVKVMRDGAETEIESADIVPGDVMLLREGVKVPADGFVIRCSDLLVDESTLTGESEGVWKVPSGGQAMKDGPWRSDYVYAGTLVKQGAAAVLVDRIGAETEYGKIGGSVAKAPEEKSHLKRQTAQIVRMAGALAAVLFVLVSAATYMNIPDHKLHERLIESALAGITLSMAMIPEEFPVILTVFLSMGAWRLARKKALVRRLDSVEALGAVTVLCVDKTGTITQNQMTVQEVWAPGGDAGELAEVMGLACETDTYDPMERAMLEYCEKIGISREHLFGDKLVAEYAFTNEAKVMGHVWRHDGEIVLAAKGSPERLLELCATEPAELDLARGKALEMSRRGLRVIAVASARLESPEAAPAELSQAELELCGLVGLADPPREGVAEAIAECYRAGVRVVMMTGDNGTTAAAIAEGVGMSDGDVITGDELERMSDEELRERARTATVFARLVPEHKMRIVHALKAGGDVVAMTGDGVNDAPALRSADVGIAMGARGSEVSREAADLVLLDDNFATIVEAIRDGRRIFDNIRKAVGYVFSIHIPIAFSSLLAPLIGISPSDLLLLPLHVMLLELIIDPTCSVVFERQPAEPDIMDRPPRSPSENILGAKMLLKSALQGIAITAAGFGAYLAALAAGPGAGEAARSMGISVLIFANLFLVLVNSSETSSVLVSAKRLLRDRVIALSIAGILAVAAVALYTPVNAYLKLSPLPAGQMAVSACLAGLSVLWYEIVKASRRAGGRKRT